MPHVQRWLREALPGYTVVGCGRGADYQGEAMTLAVRNETAELLDWRTFWLSPHPDVPGSRYQDQSECPRTCADAILYLRAEGRALRVLACRAWTDEENGVYLSDHYPLCAELAL